MAALTINRTLRGKTLKTMGFQIFELIAYINQVRDYRLFRCENLMFFFYIYRYNKALDTKKERASKASQNFGAKGQRGGHPNQVIK